MSLTRKERAEALARPFLEKLGIPLLSRPSLNGLDRILENLLPFKNGTFVEAGANNGFRQSNTYYLARFKKWTGVLIEPLPDSAEACRLTRPESLVFQCALGAPAASGTTARLRRAGLMSHICGTLGSPDHERARAKRGLSDQGMPIEESFVEVPVRTLTEVLLDSGIEADFDLLSLDVEGSETDVLRGLDLDLFRPGIICLEVQHENSGEIASLLGSRYEPAAATLSHQAHADTFWIRRGNADLTGLCE